MPVRMIVSYDGTTHDDDALMLGRMLAAAGATLALAYVRHAREYDPRREAIGRHDAERRLEQGTMWLRDDTVRRLVIVDPSTSSGLARLAATEEANLIVFGSDYRTAPGRVEPGSSAQGLLDGGSVAIAVAPAGLRADVDAAIATISVAGPDDRTGPAAETARSLVAATGGRLVAGGREADLIVVDSQPTAPAGRIALGGATRAQLDAARGSVLVLPRGVALEF